MNKANQKVRSVLPPPFCNAKGRAGEGCFSLTTIKHAPLPPRRQPRIPRTRPDQRTQRLLLQRMRQPAR